ncbi:MAG: hypothetical protein A2Z16_16515 [Chloroflexi bacterium RBG_16_54_18]|nr:MAG: hypothetical protein A2Z16_16515 [Chloroflexi bacterium RBG_16_54_18]
MAEETDFTGRVAVNESSLTLPTYRIKEPNPNPVFRSQYGVAHIYPYTLLDDIASAPVEKTYRLLVLENRFLRVSVLPELGGRVYSVFDKLAGGEVFYKNQVVKFSPLAIRGAFFSGGVEFSFPVAHAPTTADPVNWHFHHHPDGSASISIGGLEHLNQLRWMITLTLFPDRCALAQDVTLYNPSPIPGRYHYWTNASLEANDQTEFIYPLRRARSYEFAGTSSWPFTRLDLIQDDPGLPGMEGVPMWPAQRMDSVLNFRWQKNMLAQVSIFGRQVEFDFFGAWQGARDVGYAHFANHRDVSGMKLWSWGNAPFGVTNQSALTDDSSLYAETQCGAMETQLDFAFLQPDERRSWREWWLPLRGLGGLTCASSELGARLVLTPSPQVDNMQVKLGLCPARDLGSAQVSLSIPGKMLFSARLPLSPEQPRLVEFSAVPGDIAGHPLTLSVFDQSGQSVMDYTLDRQPSPILEFDQNSDSATDPAQKSYQLGVKHENFDNRELALASFEQAVAADPRNAAAHLRLGLIQLRAARLDEAILHFKQAAAAGAGGANYYAGQAATYQDKLDEARLYFQAVPQEAARYFSSILALGSLDLRREDCGSAIERFQQAFRIQPTSIAAQVYLCAALRLAGRSDEARPGLLELLERDPLNHPVLRELALSESGSKFSTRLASLLDDDPQYILDLACFYQRLGALREALQVLEEHSVGWVHPPLVILAAHLCHLLGDSLASRVWLERSEGMKLDYAFPSRLEEVAALEFALQSNPGQAALSYMLGNFKYSRERYSEAVQLWEQALKGLPDFDVLLCNLALAAWQQEEDLQKAASLFERALSANPLNQDCYLHLDDIYRALHNSAERVQLLEEIRRLDAPREDVRKRSIRMLVELNRYEEALSIMENEHFEPLEMDQSFHDLYVQANMQRAAEHLQHGRTEEAITAYKAALRYPPNLGVGAPTSAAQAQVCYLLGQVYESLGCFPEALDAFRQAAREHHPHGSELYPYVQMSLDKLSRYSELGME